MEELLYRGQIVFLKVQGNPVFLQTMPGMPVFLMQKIPAIVKYIPHINERGEIVSDAEMRGENFRIPVRQAEQNKIKLLAFFDNIQQIKSLPSHVTGFDQSFLDSWQDPRSIPLTDIRVTNFEKTIVNGFQFSPLTMVVNANYNEDQNALGTFDDGRSSY